MEPLLMHGFRFVRALAVSGVLVAGLSSAEESLTLRVSGMTFVGSRGDRAELVVHADTAFFQPDSGLADLHVVRARVSDAEKGESFRMQCDRAELDVETNDFTATGNVKGITGDGQRYSAPWVRYEHASSMLQTDAPVTVVDGGSTFRGDGFRYHIEERRFELLGNVVMEQAN
ncbi:MAG: LPS export ABC transporter periplasmic protein LptC [Myxococcales bacterium]|nr:LPS export ABC transporter periplasmic protein LptC [Myxococcales bacterium]